jgi:hypothetical protein
MLRGRAIERRGHVATLMQTVFPAGRRECAAAMRGRGMLASMGSFLNRLRSRGAVYKPAPWQHRVAPAQAGHVQRCMTLYGASVMLIGGASIARFCAAPIALFCGALLTPPAGAAECPRRILVTGYWPPTNEMVRRFSQNATQNPGGWIGSDWEARGYDIVSYFPEFPGGMAMNPKGVGDFEVDYQDTSHDWWELVPALRPTAIITFSRGSLGKRWEIESRNRKLPLDKWTDDYLVPLKPTPDLPIADEPDEFIRYSSLPMAAIQVAVAQADLGLLPVIDTSRAFGGTFLSEFIGYHGLWYRDLHTDPDDQAYVVAAGHIHVGTAITVPVAELATDVTLRTLIQYLDTVVPPVCIGDLNGDDVVDSQDLGLLLADYDCRAGAAPCPADLTCDGATDQLDLGMILTHFGRECGA